MEQLVKLDFSLQAILSSAHTQYGSTGAIQGSSTNTALELEHSYSMTSVLIIFISCSIVLQLHLHHECLLLSPGQHDEIFNFSFLSLLSCSMLREPFHFLLFSPCIENK